jgi:hypothetical protein
MGISVAVHQHTSAREGKAEKASHKTVWDQTRRFHVLLDAWVLPDYPPGRRRVAGPGREMPSRVVDSHVHHQSEYDTSARRSRL